MERDYAGRNHDTLPADPIPEWPGAVNGHAVTFFGKRLQTEEVEDAVDGDGNALMAVNGERDGIGLDGAARLEVPQRFSRASIQCVEIAFVGAGENQAARR